MRDMMENFRTGHLELSARDINGEREALIWLTERTICEAIRLKGIKRHSRYELGRHTSIAQVGLDWIRAFVRPGMQIGCKHVSTLLIRSIPVADYIEEGGNPQVDMVFEAAHLPQEPEWITRPSLSSYSGGLTGKQISNECDALAYLTECTLATLDGLASSARPAIKTLNRFIEMAQVGASFTARNARAGERFGCGRVEEVIAHDCDVQLYLEAKITRWNSYKADFSTGPMS